MTKHETTDPIDRGKVYKIYRDIFRDIRPIKSGVFYITYAKYVKHHEVLETFSLDERKIFVSLINYALNYRHIDILFTKSSHFVILLQFQNFSGFPLINLFKTYDNIQDKKRRIEDWALYFLFKKPDNYTIFEDCPF